MIFSPKVNALRNPPKGVISCMGMRLQSATGEELSPPFHFGDATQSALLLSVQSKPALSHVEGSAFQKG